MRALLRRVAKASVSADGRVIGEIGSGLLVYLGVHADDSDEDLDWLRRKTLGIRIFDDQEGRMNQSIAEEQGLLIVSQFTLFGNLKKGFRPSFHRAAPPNLAEDLYLRFVRRISEDHQGKVEKGAFGQEMSIDAVDSGPVSIWLDSKDKDY